MLLFTTACRPCHGFFKTRLVCCKSLLMRGSLRPAVWARLTRASSCTALVSEVENLARASESEPFCSSNEQRWASAPKSIRLVDKAIARIPASARPHQRAAISAALQHWLGGSSVEDELDGRSRALMVLAPGAGKTMLGLWRCERKEVVESQGDYFVDGVWRKNAIANIAGRAPQFESCVCVCVCVCVCWRGRCGGGGGVASRRSCLWEASCWW